MENCDNFLKEINACREAREWAKGKDIAQIWAECDRGDWMLWLAAKVCVDKRLLTAAKAECAALALPYEAKLELLKLIEGEEKNERGR